MTVDDEYRIGAVRIVARAEGGGGAALVSFYDPGNLVTPWLVRHAIETAIAAGWRPTLPGPAFSQQIAGKLDDRRVDVAAVDPIDPMELALLDRIADEDSAEARAVYADWLMERGDVRGAWMSRGVEVDDGTRDAWLGPVAQVTHRRRWEHGVLAGCELAKFVPGAIDRAIGHPAWRTVHTIASYGGYLSDADVVRIVTQPGLYSLAELVVSLEVATILARTDHEFANLRRLVVERAHAPIRLDTIASLEDKCPRLDTLKLALAAKLVDPLIVSTSVRRLIVDDDGSFTMCAAWLGMRGAAPEPDDTTVETVRFSSRGRGPGADLTWSRGADGAWSRLSVGFDGRYPFYRERLLAYLATMPPVATEIVIEPDGEDDVAWRRDVAFALRGQRVVPT